MNPVRYKFKNPKLKSVKPALIDPDQSNKNPDLIFVNLVTIDPDQSTKDLGIRFSITLWTVKSESEPVLIYSKFNYLSTKNPDLISGYDWPGSIYQRSDFNLSASGFQSRCEL